MVDNDIKAGHQAVKQSQRTAQQSSTLGPGTAGHTISGAAYRGKEVADNRGEARPREIGFEGSTGLGYNDRKGPDTSGYGDAEGVDASGFPDAESARK